MQTVLPSRAVPRSPAKTVGTGGMVLTATVVHWGNQFVTELHGQSRTVVEITKTWNSDDFLLLILGLFDSQGGLNPGGTYSV